jgi:hypothetical protein
MHFTLKRNKTLPQNKKLKIRYSKKIELEGKEDYLYSNMRKQTLEENYLEDTN